MFILNSIKKGAFWARYEWTFDTFNEFLQKQKSEGFDFYVCYSNRPASSYTLTASYMNSKYIKIKIEDCLTFLISKDMFTEIELTYLTTKCKITKIKTKELLDIMDSIAILFNINRIYLNDQAGIKKNKNTKIDLTLLTVMKESKTFYEKYGYQHCDPQTDKYQVPRIDLEIHKKLLRLFDFNLFIKFLSGDDKKFVYNTLDKLQKNSFEFLHEFFTQSYEYYDRKDKTKNLLKLQNLIYNKNYPWYSMIDVIQNQKICMEKFFE